MPASADRESRLAFCKLCVLHHAAKGPAYGLRMLEALAEHGHMLRSGTLHPLFIGMDWLGSQADGGGKERKACRTTAVGRKLLKQLRSEVEARYRELVPGEARGDWRERNR